MPLNRWIPIERYTLHCTHRHIDIAPITHLRVYGIYCWHVQHTHSRRTHLQFIYLAHFFFLVFVFLLFVSLFILPLPPPLYIFTDYFIFLFVLSFSRLVLFRFFVLSIALSLPLPLLLCVRAFLFGDYFSGIAAIVVASQPVHNLYTPTEWKQMKLNKWILVPWLKRDWERKGCRYTHPFLAIWLVLPF